MQQYLHHTVQSRNSSPTMPLVYIEDPPPRGGPEAQQAKIPKLPRGPSGRGGPSGAPAKLLSRGPSLDFHESFNRQPVRRLSLAFKQRPPATTWGAPRRHLIKHFDSLPAQGGPPAFSTRASEASSTGAPPTHLATKGPPEKPRGPPSEPREGPSSNLASNGVQKEPVHSFSQETNKGPKRPPDPQAAGSPDIWGPLSEPDERDTVQKAGAPKPSRGPPPFLPKGSQVSVQQKPLTGKGKGPPSSSLGGPSQNPETSQEAPTALVKAPSAASLDNQGAPVKSTTTTHLATITPREHPAGHRPAEPQGTPNKPSEPPAASSVLAAKPSGPPAKASEPPAKPSGPQARSEGLPPKRSALPAKPKPSEPRALPNPAKPSEPPEKPPGLSPKPWRPPTKPSEPTAKPPGPLAEPSGPPAKPSKPPSKPTRPPAKPSGPSANPSGLPAKPSAAQPSQRGATGLHEKASGSLGKSSPASAEPSGPLAAPPPVKPSGPPAQSSTPPPKPLEPLVEPLGPSTKPSSPQAGPSGSPAKPSLLPATPSTTQAESEGPPAKTSSPPTKPLGDTPAKPSGPPAKPLGAPSTPSEPPAKPPGPPAKPSEPPAKASGPPVKPSGPLAKPSVPQAKPSGPRAKPSGLPVEALGLPTKASGPPRKRTEPPAKPSAFSAKAEPSKALIKLSAPQGKSTGLPAKPSAAPSTTEFEPPAELAGAPAKHVGPPNEPSWAPRPAKSPGKHLKSSMKPTEAQGVSGESSGFTSKSPVSPPEAPLLSSKPTRPPPAPPLSLPFKGSAASLKRAGAPSETRGPPARPSKRLPGGEEAGASPKLSTLPSDRASEPSGAPTKSSKLPPPPSGPPAKRAASSARASSGPQIPAEGPDWGTPAKRAGVPPDQQALLAGLPAGPTGEGETPPLDKRRGALPSKSLGGPSTTAPLGAPSKLTPKAPPLQSLRPLEKTSGLRKAEAESALLNEGAPGAPASSLLSVSPAPPCPKGGSPVHEETSENSPPNGKTLLEVSSALRDSPQQSPPSPRDKDTPGKNDRRLPTSAPSVISEPPALRPPGAASGGEQGPPCPEGAPTSFLVVEALNNGRLQRSLWTAYQEALKKAREEQGCRGPQGGPYMGARRRPSWMLPEWEPSPAPPPLTQEIQMYKALGGTLPSMRHAGAPGRAPVGGPSSPTLEEASARGVPLEGPMDLRELRAAVVQQRRRVESFLQGGGPFERATRLWEEALTEEAARGQRSRANSKRGGPPRVLEALDSLCSQMQQIHVINKNLLDCARAPSSSSYGGPRTGGAPQKIGGLGAPAATNPVRGPLASGAPLRPKGPRLGE
ncbi:hypothetical protein Esti_000434 [Eimeria stiedai]